MSAIYVGIYQLKEMSWTQISYVIGLLIGTVYSTGFDNRWKHWWGYDPMSGPDKWAEYVPAYSLCSGGKQQSPINIQPDILLFDPNLKHVRVENQKVNGYLMNTGNDITFLLNNEFTTRVNVSEGPLSYSYHVTSIKFHFSKVDRSGSEHKIAGQSFPAEMQIIGYNGELYDNMSRAENSSNGVVILSTFLAIHDNEDTLPNEALTRLTANFNSIHRLNTTVQINGFSIGDLLPKTHHYITYEGSMTQPSCQETVTWIIFNKPSYMTREQMFAFQDVSMEWTENNCRPPMPLNHRVVRTNINSAKQSRMCSMKRDIFYKVNSIFRT